MAAGIRLHEELGLTAELAAAGTFTYRAGDIQTGRVEYEFDHVLVGIATGADPHPDPAEVAAFTWIRPADLGAAAREHPGRYAPWLPRVLDLAVFAHEAGRASDRAAGS